MLLPTVPLQADSAEFAIAEEHDTLARRKKRLDILQQLSLERCTGSAEGEHPPCQRDDAMLERSCQQQNADLILDVCSVHYQVDFPVWPVSKQIR